MVLGRVLKVVVIMEVNTRRFQGHLIGPGDLRAGVQRYMKFFKRMSESEAHSVTAKVEQWRL